MSEPTITCSNCKREVQRGKVCGYCGLDAQTGETFHMRVSKAKGAKDKRPPLTSSIGVLVLVAFGSILLAGFMYQRKTIELIREDDSVDYIKYVEQLEKMDEMLTENKNQQVKGLAQSMIDQLDEKISAVKENRYKRGLLGNLKAKAQRRRSMAEE